MLHIKANFNFGNYKNERTIFFLNSAIYSELKRQYQTTKKIRGGKKSNNAS